MYNKYRQAFNAKFSPASYQKFLEKLNSEFNYTIPFRVAETPVFFSRNEKDLFVTAANEILRQVLALDLNKIAEGYIPVNRRVPGNEGRPHFIAIDFAITLDQNAEIVPKLIELQGFPSLFYYQPWLYHQYLDHYDLPDNLSPFFCNGGEQQYYDTLKKILLGDCPPENVILLEIEPEKQNTAIDFFITKKVLGIEYVCLSKIIVKGDKLYYIKNGEQVQIKRIYNRIIFDELDQRKDFTYALDFTRQYDVEWITHPDWFFKISKLLLPHIDSKFAPKCIKVSELKEIPSNLEAFVLKPLFSFSGSGVIFHVSTEDISSIPEHQRDKYVLQEKVTYAEIISDPGDSQKSKAELRILFVWPDGEDTPKPMINLMRLSKGEMIGVKYNKNKTWVGGSIGLFEE